MSKKDIKGINKAIKKGIKIHTSFIPDEVCPDQIVCQIETDSDAKITKASSTIWNRKSISQKEGKSRIILILESPHSDEYRGKNNIEPAKGKTGKNIRTYIHQAFSSLDDNPLKPNTLYELLLINAIQYQCSMGLPTDFFRTVSFIGIWFKFGKKSFVNRLSDLGLKADDIVINCCTKGDNTHFKSIFKKNLTENSLRELFDNTKINFSAESGLSGLIDKEINTILKNNSFEYRKIDHPSYWDKSYRDKKINPRK